MTYPIKTLIEICSVKTGRHDANHGAFGGKYPFFTCADKPIKSPTYSFDGDSIILPGNGANVGLVLYYSGKFEAYQRTYILNEFKCNPRYVYHHLRCFWSAANRFIQFGSATNYIRMGNFESYKIPIPPPNEQKQIAEILDRAEELRSKRREAITQLDTLTQAIFLEMFGNPSSNHQNSLKLPLSELCAIDSPLVDPTLPEYENLFHIGPDRIERNTGKLLPAKTAKQDGLTSVKFRFKSDCILYSKIRPYLNKVALATESGLCSADMYPVTVRSEIAVREFIWYLLLSDDFLKYAATLSNRSNIPKINRKQFLAYPAICPPLKLQKQFANRVTAIETLKTAHRDSLSELDALFASLQHRAFKGEL